MFADGLVIDAVAFWWWTPDSWSCCFDRGVPMFWKLVRAPVPGPLLLLLLLLLLSSPSGVPNFFDPSIWHEQLQGSRTVRKGMGNWRQGWDHDVALSSSLSGRNKPSVMLVKQSYTTDMDLWLIHVYTCLYLFIHVYTCLYHPFMVNFILTKTNCFMVILDTHLDFHPLSVEVPVPISSMIPWFRKLGNT